MKLDEVEQGHVYVDTNVLAPVDYEGMLENITRFAMLPRDALHVTAL